MLLLKRTQGIVRCTCFQRVYNLEESKTDSQITIKQNRVREVGPSTTQPVYFSAKKKKKESEEEFMICCIKVG